ncbi:MAG: response regulator [Moraxellaceae bacterium]|nr:response regulator [Moraxellaceae bacterium]MBP7229233.1 response regulator [Moraxellaceae bacterium]MBP8852185.1 response regulator [Moraxellaceae bacterium]MBP9045726.1 response regulator [Moraxellaceae bacterium]HQV41595.1 response regulator [Moraxellaceae bacterium]
MPTAATPLFARLRHVSYKVVLAALIGGISLSLALSLWVAQQVDKQVEARFEQISTRHIERIRGRLELYVYGLKGIRGIFSEAPEAITPERFQTYLNSHNHVREFPGVTTWAFAERIPAQELPREHLAQHQISHYIRLDGQTDPNAGQEAWVLRLAESTTQQEGIIGLDLASEPLRQQTAYQSMQTGLPALSPLLPLVSKSTSNTKTGFLLMLPVYYRDLAHSSNVSGWVIAAIDGDHLFNFLRDDKALNTSLTLSISDITDAENLLYSNLPSTANVGQKREQRLRLPHAQQPQHIETIQFGGRTWQVSISANPAFYSGADRWLPPMTLAIGTLLSLLMAGALGFSSSLRRDAEEKTRTVSSSLRDRETLLESTIASMDDWVFVLDPDGRVMDCHEPPHSNTWQPREDFLNKPLASALPVAAHADLSNALNEVRTHRHASFEFSLHRTQHSRQFVARLSSRREGDGALLGATMIARDVSREREQARDLLVSEQKFRLLFAEAPLAILLTQENHYTDANPAALKLFGLPNSASLQHANIDVLSPLTQPDGQPSESGIRHIMQQAIAAGPQHREWMFRRLSNGELFPAELHLSAIELHGEPYFLAMVTNLSSQKQNEQILIQARDAAEAASHEKSEFLATMSHEIRTPMNGVLGMAQLMASSPLNSEQRDQLNTILQSGHSLLAIINDILDFSKIEAGKLSFEEVPFDLQIAIDETCELLLPAIRQKDLSLTVKLDPTAPFHVIGDPGRFRQVLLNYLSNAIKFTQQGGIEVSLTTRERGRGATLFELSVADTGTGIGIDPDKQSALFEKFTHVDTNRDHRFGGTGLGLAICKALVERMGGKVSMASAPGSGSTFRATFWLTLDPDAGHQTLPAIVPSLRGAPVLVIDGSTTNRELLVKGLAKGGLAVYGAGSVAEALLAVQRQSPRFVLLDAELPDGDADALITALRAEPALGAAVLILLSSRLDSSDQAFCRTHGIAAYLPKPARLGWIISAMNILATNEHDGLVTRHTLSHHHSRGNPLLTLRKGIRVLLVEDNAINLKVAARMLERMGCHVDMAGNGLEALAMAAQLPYDVIMMDVQMPEMDGISATRELRSRGFSDIPIIALTANSRDEDKQACRAAGMSDFLSKPIRYEDLHTCLSRWI